MTMASKLARLSRPLSVSARNCSTQAFRTPMIMVTMRTTTRPSNFSTLPSSHYLIRFNSSTPTPVPTPTTNSQPIYSQTEDGIATAATESPSVALAGETTPTVTSAVTDVAAAASELSTFPPVMWCTELMQWLHHATGIPWWGTIMLATLTVRICLFPVMGKVMKNNLKLAAVKPHMDAYNAKIRMGVSPEQREQATRDLYAFMAKEGVQPWKSMLGVLAQAPVFMLFYFTLQNLTKNNIDHMDTGGALWFTDLTLPDPYYILSLATAGTFILAIELGADTGQSMAKTASFIKNIFRFMGVAFIPITATFQSGLLVYWSFNSLMSLVQMLIFKMPAVRRLFNLPKPAVSQPKVQIPNVIFDSPASAKAGKAVKAPAVKNTQQK